MQAETRDLLDSLDNNKHKGQLLLLDKLPTQQKTSNLFSQSLFITSLARDTTANHKIYGHVASHGTLVMAAHNATDKKLGLFHPSCALTLQLAMMTHHMQFGIVASLREANSSSIQKLHLHH